MGPLLRHLSVVEDDDVVGVDDCRESVGDDDGGAALLEAFQGVLHGPFGFVVEGGGCFIQK